MMLPRSILSIFRRLLWQVLELLFVSMLLVFSLSLTILLIVSLPLIWLLGTIRVKRAGIGINAGRIRALGSRIRDGEVKHTGVIPFLKKFEATVRCCTQNGVRGGSATVHFPIWHREIEDILVLKNNKGTEDNRVRKLDYSINSLSCSMKDSFQDEEITLFSPHDVPGLYDAFGH